MGTDIDFDPQEELVQMAPRRQLNGAAPVVASPSTGGEVDRPRASDEFIDDQLLPVASRRPEQGWRRIVFEATGGRVNFGPGPAERQRAAMVARVRAPLAGCRRIAVVSRKGGVGKTSTTLGLGHTFAVWRHDRVVALDANPDAGTLGYRLPAVAERTLTDLLADADVIRKYSQARQYTAQAVSRLELVASDDDPRITQAVGETEYATAVDVLERHYNIVLTDTGTDITHSVMQGVLSAADQLVVVVAPGLDGARAAAKTLDWLDENGHAHLVADAVAAINAVPRRSKLDLDRVAGHFGRRCRAVVGVPWDAHLEAGAQTGLDDLGAATRRAYLELAAAVADGFAPTLTRSTVPSPTR